MKKVFIIIAVAIAAVSCQKAEVPVSDNYLMTRVDLTTLVEPDYEGVSTPFLQTGVSYTYSLENVAPGAEVEWNISGDLSVSYSSDNLSATVMCTSDEVYVTGGVTATVSIPQMAFSLTYGTSHIGFWNSGIFHDDSLISGYMTNEGGYVELSEYYPGASGYEWNAMGYSTDNQGQPSAEFVRVARNLGDEVDVSVSFSNPFDEQVTIVRTFILP